jgi:hypothetical protein
MIRQKRRLGKGIPLVVWRQLDDQFQSQAKPLIPNGAANARDFEVELGLSSVRTQLQIGDDGEHAARHDFGPPEFRTAL